MKSRDFLGSAASHCAAALEKFTAGHRAQPFSLQTSGLVTWGRTVAEGTLVNWKQACVWS